MSDNVEDFVVSRFTHEGTIKGVDNRTPDGYQFREALRETKRYWVTTHGIKYRKAGGRGIGDWPLYRLDLDSVTLCTHNGKDDGSDE